jgi:lipoprotein NlpI
LSSDHIALGGKGNQINRMRALPLLIALLMTAMANMAHAGGVELARQGLAAQQQGQWQQAIDLFSQALAAGDLSTKNKAEVLGLRANAYGATGSSDKALADFAAAMEVAPGQPAPYVGRSIVYRQMGDYAHAIEDATTALAHSPAYVLAHTNRGLANFYAGNFAAAADDFFQSRKADPREPDFVVWLHLARARAGQDDGAELAANAAPINPDIWSGPAVYFFLGKVNPEDLPTLAATQNPVVQMQQSCEASFYLGEADLLAGDKGAARWNFQAVIKACDLYKSNYAWFSNAYGGALTELKRLDQ